MRELNVKNYSEFMKEVENFFNKRVMKSSAQSYQQIAEDFFEWILGIYIKIELTSIFTETNLKEYRKKRKSTVVRAVFNNLLVFMVEKNYISNEEYHKFNDTVIDVYKEKQESSSTVRFLKREEVNHLLYDVQYKNDEQHIQAKIIILLAFHLFFEQNQIASLKVNDYISEKGLIKNPKWKEELQIKQWLSVPEELKFVIEKYIDDLDYEEVYLLTKTQIPFENGDFGNICEKTKTGVNAKYFRKGYYPINIQMLIKSGLLYRLVDSDGKGLFEIIAECGYNKHVKDAIDRYFEWCITHGKIGEENVPFVDIGRGDSSIASDDYYEVESAEEEKSDEFSNENQIYNENNDLTWEMLMEYDSFNNQKTSDVSIERLVRNTRKAEMLKKIYDNECQLCGYKLMDDKGGYYSEGHHIKPYNKTHKGDDVISNMVILCPNCHVLFDKLVYAIDPETELVNCLYSEDL